MLRLANAVDLPVECEEWRRSIVRYVLLVDEHYEGRDQSANHVVQPFPSPVYGMKQTTCALLVQDLAELILPVRRATGCYVSIAFLRFRISLITFSIPIAVLSMA